MPQRDNASFAVKRSHIERQCLRPTVEDHSQDGDPCCRESWCCLPFVPGLSYGD
jgi:hypothetical protein